MDALVTGAGLELVGPPGSAAVWDALRLWVPRATDTSQLSFATTVTEPVLWRVELPTDADQASARLLEASQQLDLTDRTIRSAGARLAAPRMDESSNHWPRDAWRELAPRWAAFTSGLTETIN